MFPQVLEDNNQWWKLRNRSGQTGYVPFNMLEVVNVDDPGFSQVSRRFSESPAAAAGHHPAVSLHLLLPLLHPRAPRAPDNFM